MELKDIKAGQRFRFVEDDDGVYEVLWHSSTGAVQCTHTEPEYAGRQMIRPEMEVVPCES